MVSRHGTPDPSACAETGMTLSGVAVAMRKSTESCWTSCEVTVAARAEDDWLSCEMISTEYFLPPIVRPLASAARTWPSTYPFDWVNTDSCPVSGLTKPIFIVPPDPDPVPVDAVEEPADFRALEQPARPTAPTAPAAPAAPRKTRLLKRPPWPPGFAESVICFSPHVRSRQANAHVASLSARPAGAVLHY